MILVVALIALAALLYLSRGVLPDLPGTPQDTPPPPEPLPTGAPEIVGEPHEWDNQIIFACMTYGLVRDAPAEYTLVKAIIKHESGFDEGARGDAPTCRDNPPCCGLYRGDAFYTGFASIGLMQINRCAHGDRWGDLRDGNENILAGVQLLRVQYELYWPDWRRVVAGYNGPAFASLPDWETNPTPGARQVTRYADRVGAIYRPLAAQAGIMA